MKSTLLWALIVLNVALLALFIGRLTHDNTAMAQGAPAAPPAARRMGDYLTIAGDVNGGDSGVVYIVDTSNELLGAMAYDDTRNAIDVMPTLSISSASSSSPSPYGSNLFKK